MLSVRQSSNDIENQITANATQSLWERGGRIVRRTLPFVTAFGYPLAMVTLFIRAVYGDASQPQGISTAAIRGCVYTVLVPAAIATATTGAKALKQLCANKSAEAKKVILESISPGGFISDVVFPRREMEMLRQAAMEVDGAMAVASTNG